MSMPKSEINCLIIATTHKVALLVKGVPIHWNKPIRLIELQAVDTRS